MTDILDLEGWQVIGKHRGPDGYEIEAEYTVQPAACTKCGSVGNLYRHGPKPVILRDSPIRGHHVRILAKVQRYKCRDCSGTFLQPLGGIQPDTRMTARCVEYIRSQSLRDTFVRIAEHVGCDDKTVRNVANDYIAELEASHRPYLPEWIGIDETMIDGKQRCVIADVGRNLPIDMLVDREKPTVTGWLYKFRDRSQVKGLAIDMWRPYLDAARSVFPGLPVVIDKFHVVRMANLGMEKARIRLAKTKERDVGKDWKRRKSLLRLREHSLDDKARLNLDMWLTNEPAVAEAYRLKEEFYGVYAARSKSEAAKALDDWRASVPTALKADFKELLSATRNWREEILAYFDHPISNGYTEALNGVAKVINRAGRGYSFEVLRARLLFKERKTMLQAPADLTIRYERNRAVRASLLAASDGRCASCQGAFEPHELQVHSMRPVVAGERTSGGVLICQHCHRRFHTEASSRHDS